MDKIVKKCLWKCEFISNIFLKNEGVGLNFLVPRPGKRVFVNIITIRAMFLVFLVNNFKTWEKVLLQRRSFVCFTKLQRSWMFCFWVQRFPSLLLQDIKRLYCTSQESTRIQRYTKIHDNTKTKETQCYARKSTRIHEKTQKTEYNAWKDGTIGKNTTKPTIGHAAFM